MIDTHCHIVFGVDDGAQTLEDAIAMLKVAQADGMTNVISTSHCVPGIKFENDKEVLTPIYNEIVAEMKRLDMNIEFHLGSELMLTPKAIKWLKEKRIATLNDSKWVLCEIPWNKNLQFEIDEDQALRSVLELGYKVIIAHPERYPQVHADYGKLDYWKSIGCFFQINSTSLLDPTREVNYRLAWRMMEDGYCDVIATDAHRHQGTRTNKLSSIYSIIQEKYGEQEAKRLMVDNPLRLIKNETLIRRSNRPQSLIYSTA